MSPDKRNLLDRRRFFRAVGSVSTVAAAAAAMPLASPEEAQAYDPGRNELRARYRPDSPDVQAFYRTNGYETLKK